MNTKPTVQSFGNPMADLAATLMGFQPVVQRPDNLKPCPCCNIQPAIDPAFHGKVCVYCDNDDCSQSHGDGWPHALGDTLAQAVEKWNALPTDHEIAGSGVIK